MKIGILGGGNCYALNLASHASNVFGIGRSPQKHPAMWAKEHYRYYQCHLVSQLEAALSILDTERPDYIVNFAAQGEGQGSFGQDAHLFYQTNTVTLVKLVEALRHRKWLKKFIQIGTSELYGSVEAPSKETDPIKPTSPYAVSKAAFDLHLEVMGRVHGFPYTIIRPSNAYCRGQQLYRIIPNAIISALSGSRLTLHGGGVAEKTYLHANDLSQAILTLASSGSGIYNCGELMPVSIRHVVELVANATGVNFEDFVDIGPERQGQDSRYWLDSTKLRSVGWSPSISLEEGISDMVAWIKSNPDILRMDKTWTVRP